MVVIEVPLESVLDPPNTYLPDYLVPTYSAVQYYLPTTDQVSIYSPIVLLGSTLLPARYDIVRGKKNTKKYRILRAG